MRKNFSVKIMLQLALFAVLMSCNNARDYKNTSRATGWDLDSQEGGFNYNSDFDEQEPGPGLVFVEGGTFTMGRVQDDVMYDWNNTPTQQHVQSFYMDETEVTNLMYLEYLDYLKNVYPPSEERYRNIYQGALPDTLVWRNRLGYNETMTNNYLRHPAYANYPVVGVSWIQAVEFSSWRTDRVNELRLEEEGFIAEGARYNREPGQHFSTETYLNAPSQVYGGNEELSRGGRNADRFQVGGDEDTTQASGLYAQRKHGILLPEYRLPTEAEWEYAAAALVEVRSYNAYRGRKKYPWDSQYTRTGDPSRRGDQMANFKQGDGDYGGIAGWSDDGADITAEVKSYESNDFGLYDMAGNVAEWVLDVYRPIIDDDFNDFNYFRGNIYTQQAINEDGSVRVVGTEDITHDTLSNGRVIVRNLPGEIATVPISREEAQWRPNFSQSDNRNFRDGDNQSTRYFDAFAEEETFNVDTLEEGEREDNDYADPDDEGILDEDQIRVIKGGSWRDRAYWLDPATRRYFPQDMATDYIGFRNAMSRVGSHAIAKNKTARN